LDWLSLFASRDDLLTALILDAYNALGEAAEAADAARAGRPVKIADGSLADVSTRRGYRTSRSP
jgi:hypothetical protein